MPYIGNDIRSNEDYKIIDDISSGFNGSESSFGLQVSGSAPVPFPKFAQQLLISINGVIQEPDPTGSTGFKISAPNIVSNTVINSPSGKGMDGGMKEVFSKIADKHPSSA